MSSLTVRARERAVEHCFYEHGYAPLFQRLAGLQGKQPADRVIKRAIDLHSKPLLALELVLAAAAAAAPGVPPPLRNTIEACVRLARGADNNRSEAVILPAGAGVE